MLLSLLHDLGSIDHAIKIAFNSIDGRERDNLALFGESGTTDLFDDDVDDARISKVEFRNLLLHSRGYNVGVADHCHDGEDCVDRTVPAAGDNSEVAQPQSKELTDELSRTVDSEVETFFKLLDTDNNGFLDLTEFVKKQE